MGPDVKQDKVGPVRDMCDLAMTHEGLLSRGTAQRSSGRGQGEGPPAAPWTGPSPARQLSGLPVLELPQAAGSQPRSQQTGVLGDLLRGTPVGM